MGFEWKLYYQPTDFKVGNMLESKKELVSLCNVAKQNDIKIYADAVCNHVANIGDNDRMARSSEVAERLQRDDFYKEKTEWKIMKIVTKQHII